MSARRPLRQESAALAVAGFLLVVLNTPFWRALGNAVAPQSAYEWMFMVAVFVVALALLNLLLNLCLVPSLLRLVSAALLIPAAAASYFMGEYGVVIDSHMVQNVIETNAAEARDLLTGKAVAYVLALGVLPSWLLWKLPMFVRPWRDEWRVKAKISLASIVIAGLATAPFYMSFASTFRAHKELKHTLIPLNIVSALVKELKRQGRAVAATIRPFGEDATRRSAIASGRPPSVTVLVIGETARADHFSLLGYARQTNPRLSRIPELLVFDRVHSCGTDTAQSVPCMFSGVGRARFQSDIAVHQEGLLDIVARTGVSVLWRENQAGCKGVCARVPTEYLTKSKSPVHCADGECHDEILLDGLEARIEALKTGALIVLHMMGSHGPAYSKRYPKAFEVFTPVCAESQFSRCENAAIVNAYDNTILYTDHVLAALIEMLQRSEEKGFATAMLYVSDHGESLGENNLYLHGMPYAIAPEAQTHVPMVAWLSQTYRRENGLDASCLERQTKRELSHDHLFHSVLGMLGIESRVYEKGLDLTAPCRSRAGASAVPGERKPPSL